MLPIFHCSKEGCWEHMTCRCGFWGWHSGSRRLPNVVEALPMRQLISASNKLLLMTVAPRYVNLLSTPRVEPFIMIVGGLDIPWKRTTVLPSLIFKPNSSQALAKEVARRLRTSVCVRDNSSIVCVEKLVNSIAVDLRHGTNANSYNVCPNF